MKTPSKIFLSLILSALALSSTTLVSPALADYNQSNSDNYRRLATQPGFRQHQQNRVLQEVAEWKAHPGPVSAQLLEDVREHVNFAPRHPILRPALEQMLARQKPTSGNLQDQELYYYKLLSLAMQNKTYQQKLAQLLYQKHGGHSRAEVQQAYSRLNDAFNTWDEGKYDEALRLFRQAQLKRSPELTALLAYHLRDRGQVEEAKKLLQNFSGQRGYLHWIDDMLQEIKTAENIEASQFPDSDKISAWLTLGQLERAQLAIKKMPEGPMKHWYQAKIYEKQGQYHPAAAEYSQYYRGRWQDQIKGFVPIVYKAQLEDVNSLDLIALKFRTSPDLIRQVNEAYPHDWIETYRMLIVPVPHRDLAWPVSGDYVSSHFGYRLHPIHGTWLLHEGVDIETMPGSNAHAALSGKVVEAHYDKACGNFVRLQHQNPHIRTVYCHGEKILTPLGTKVSQGQAVIETGNTGASASNHLHFGVQEWRHGKWTFVSPFDWL